MTQKDVQVTIEAGRGMNATPEVTDSSSFRMLNFVDDLPLLRL